MQSKKLKTWLKGYFNHKTKKPFPLKKLDLSGGTPFQQKVWCELWKIPYGKLKSYGWIAKKIGHPGAARAVGAACGKNPYTIVIPCHRVIASDGSIGGYSGGIKMKKKLLKHEGYSEF